MILYVLMFYEKQEKCVFITIYFDIIESLIKNTNQHYFKKSVHCISI